MADTNPTPPSYGPYETNPKFPLPDGEISINIYGYTPSIILGIVGIVVFLIGLVAHTFWLFKYRTTRVFEALVAWTCLMEVVGYGGRAAASKNPFLLNPFIIQYFFIVVAPVFLAAALYWALSVIIRSRPAYRSLSPLGPRMLIAVFVIFDVLTIFAQVVGAAFIGASESQSGRGKVPFISPDNANNIVIAGLAVQAAAFLVFLLIFVFFFVRLYGKNSPITASERPNPKMFVTILVAGVLIYMRTLFRLAESAQGLISQISRNQALFGVFETMPIMLTVLILAAFPLGRFTDFNKARTQQEIAGEKHS
ncbi:hypothetical protein OC861_004739 [Tilletia horrida]|nr:hypothetical protein OC861_004739 [Tilletia horrida]